MKKMLAFFLAYAVAMGVMAGTVVTTGCNSSQALAKVEQFDPVVINALNLYCAVQPGNPVCGTAKATIQSDYNVVVQLWSDYNKAYAAGTSTVAAWNALNAAFLTFENDSAQIFSLASGLNQQEITAIVAAGELLLAAIEAVFPGAPAGTNAKAKVFAAHAVGRTSYDKAWLQGWIKDYNAKVGTAKKLHPGVKLDTVHLHTLHLGVAKLGW